jgi:enoyl-[acyl-carrier protein] reductase II
VAELGADALIAQGSECGGFCANISALSLIPQVVDALGHRLPMVAAGGIADGRGVAAALLLGAQGINIGTRFLASVEAAVSQNWKNRILSAESEHAIKAGYVNDIFHSTSTATYEDTSPRALSTPFIEECNSRSKDEVKQQTNS